MKTNRITASLISAMLIVWGTGCVEQQIVRVPVSQAQPVYVPEPIAPAPVVTVVTPPPITPPPIAQPEPETPAPPAIVQPAAPPPEPVTPWYPPAELDRMLAPIAIYPDPLIAQILPAATQPAEIVLAARYVRGGADMLQIDNQPWQESVKVLARYPDVLKMMDERLDWTSTLGQAFVSQPADVMQSIQRLRAQAQMLGNSCLGG